MSRSLACEQLTCSFGRGRGQRRVLDGLSWSVAAGTTGVLLGPSGSGKSTLLRIVAGLERNASGTVRLGEAVLQDARTFVAPERRRVGFVFQDLELWPHLTVAANVGFGLSERPSARAARRHPRVRALAERLGFSALLQRRPPQLSGGERQRVALARALAPEPDVVLLDEPLASLDPARRGDLLALLGEVTRERGATVIHVTHDPAEALFLADEVAVLESGRIVERGAPARLYEQPRTAAAARALGPANLVPARREGDTWDTPLGRLAARDGAADGAAGVLVRPEDLVVAATAPGAGALAEVLAVWPRGPGWGLRARVGGLEVEARAPSPPPAPGARVLLRVLTPVGGLEVGPGSGGTEARCA